MTDKEKAKAYDEAIERAKELLEVGLKDTRDKRVVLSFFPELAESEDERIRKMMIRYFESFGNLEWYDGLTPQKAIAWLEKQGEQKPVEQQMYWTEEEIEPIISDYLCGREHYGGMIGRLCHLKPKQKPVWSEEDEDNFKHLLDEIVCLGNNRNSANRLYYDRLINFIKELKNRAHPKEKWCDKDERMLDRLIAYFEKRVAFTDDDNPRYANWLKSFKGRIQKGE